MFFLNKNWIKPKNAYKLDIPKKQIICVLQSKSFYNLLFKCKKSCKHKNIVLSKDNAQFMSMI